VNTALTLAESAVLADAGPSVDFSQDNGWIVLVKAILIFVFLLLTTLLAIWAERRILGRMQTRPGPNRTGPFGLLQSLADGLKAMLKEDINPRAVDKVIYIAAPIVSASAAFVIFSVIPFGPEVKIPFTDIVTPLQLADIPVAALFVLAISAVGVYGIVMGGWSSGSTYPLLGAVRSAAQVISYELALSLSLVSVLIVSGSMSTSQIVDSQQQLWWSIALFPAFIIFVISMIGETNRAPFDLPEAEGELVSGFMTEYSAMKFAMFFLAEYINMINVSAIATTLFLGGWRAPWPLSAINDGMFNTGYWPVLWFVGKLWLFLFLFIWVRGTLPRMRYDQFMKLGWKVLIPAGLGWIMAVSLVQGVRQFSDVDLRTLLSVIGGVLLLFVIVSFFWPQKQAEEPEIDPGEFDAFAAGYPVPPLPGQVLPPSPRQRGPKTVQASSSGGTLTAEAAPADEEVSRD